MSNSLNRDSSPHATIGSTSDVSGRVYCGGHARCKKIRGVLEKTLNMAALAGPSSPAVEKRRFQPDDPLTLPTMNAYDFHALNVEVGDLSFESGVQQLPAEPHDQPQPHGNQRRGD